MISGIYIVDRDMSLTNDGVVKKIKLQIDALEKFGIKCETIVPKKKNSRFDRIVGLFPFVKLDSEWQELELKKPIDFVYIRKPALDIGFMKLLKSLKNIYGVKCIILEIPTFPYDKEYRIRRFNYFYKDFFWRHFLHRYIDYISTYSLDKLIFGIPCINIMNGIDVDSFCISKCNSNEEIHIVVIALMYYWHGYDRLLLGLADYYKKDYSRKIYVDMIGEGPELARYRRIVEDNGIEQYVKFYGALAKEEYEKIIDNGNIAAENLGNYRKGVRLSSSLKSREYVAKGLPMITSSVIDAFPENECDYIISFPEDDSPIEMKRVVDWYEELIKNHGDLFSLREYIHDDAKERCDIKNTMAPVKEILFEKMCEKYE